MSAAVADEARTLRGLASSAGLYVLAALAPRWRSAVSACCCCRSTRAP